MKAVFSVLDVTLSLNAFILMACLILCAVGGCKSVSTESVKSTNTVDVPNVSGWFTSGGGAGVSTEPGIAVDPADLPKAQSETTTEPRFVPNPYTDDVIKHKQKMRDAENK